MTALSMEATLLLRAMKLSHAELDRALVLEPTFTEWHRVLIAEREWREVVAEWDDDRWDTVLP